MAGSARADFSSFVEVARLLNRDFVAIKVDRELRPDVDALYMSALHAMRSRGGWPLNMFLTPDREPFYGGTYFPKARFTRTLESVSRRFRENREEVVGQASRLC